MELLVLFLHFLGFDMSSEIEQLQPVEEATSSDYNGANPYATMVDH